MSKVFIDGYYYDVKKIDRNILRNDKLFDELELVDANIKNEIQDLLISKTGISYMFYNRSNVIAVYLFRINNESKELTHYKTLTLNTISDAEAELLMYHLILELKDNIHKLKFNKIVLLNGATIELRVQVKRRMLLIKITGTILAYIIGILIRPNYLEAAEVPLAFFLYIWLIAGNGAEVFAKDGRNYFDEIDDSSTSNIKTTDL